jgi:hypothetical protein
MGIKMRVLKYRTFCEWAKSEKLTDYTLIKAVEEIEKGLFDANIGNGLYKKRIAKKGKGKRAGYRVILGFKYNNKAIFLYGFSKNERDNISERETLAYKKLAGYFLQITDQQLTVLIKNGELFEVSYEDFKKS